MLKKSIICFFCIFLTILVFNFRLLPVFSSDLTIAHSVSSSVVPDESSLKFTEKIGPSGKTIIFGKVAVVKVPEGAVDTVHQITIEYAKVPIIRTNEVLISPVVKIHLDVDSQSLRKKILVRLNLDRNYIGKNHPGVVEYYQPTPCLESEEKYCTVSLESVDSPSKTTFETFYFLENTSEIVYATLRKMYINRQFTVIEASAPPLPKEFID